MPRNPASTHEPSDVSRGGRRIDHSALRLLLAVLVTAGLAVATVPATAQGEPQVDLPATRLAGADRVATAEVVARAWVDGGGRSTTVVVVPRTATGVALSTAGLAGRLGTVTLLSDQPPSASTVEVARAVGASQAVVVGGGATLQEGWAAAGFTVSAIEADGGLPAVAAAVARRTLQSPPTGQPAAPVVWLAGTSGLPDAVAAGPVLREGGAPLLLTAPTALDPHARFLLQQESVGSVVVVGGPAVVGEEVVDELRASGIQVRRVAGPDRATTALALAEGRRADRVMVAAGDDPADAVSVAALAQQTHGIILPPGPATSAWLAQRCGRTPPITVVGGTAVVDAPTEAGLRRDAQRCDGPRDPMTVRVAVATPGAPGEAQAIADLVTGPDGWGSRRLHLVGVGTDPHLGIVVGDVGVCGGPALCRRGADMVIDGGAYTAASTATRRRMVALAVGSWLGEPVTEGCRGGVMDPLGCAGAAVTPSPVERAAVADRHVPTISLALAGDVHAERHIATALAEGRNPLQPVAPLLTQADIAVVNLETPLSTRGTPAAKTYTFRGPPAMAAALADAGVDVVSLANNHALDYGEAAMLDTLTHATAAGLATVGAGVDADAAYAPVLIDTVAGRVAVLGLTRVLHTRAWEATATRAGMASAYDEAAAVRAVGAARDAADHVVVAIHWGTERADCPDDAQRRLARLLADAGADVVVGHHPHVLQGVQQLGGTLVVYSLGNFVWYHDRAPSRFTGVLQVDLPTFGSATWRLDPAEIGRDGSPHPVDGAVADHIHGRVTTRSPGGSAGCRFP